MRSKIKIYVYWRTTTSCFKCTCIFICHILKPPQVGWYLHRLWFYLKIFDLFFIFIIFMKTVVNVKGVILQTQLSNWHIKQIQSYSSIKRYSVLTLQNFHALSLTSICLYLPDSDSIHKVECRWCQPDS